MKLRDIMTEDISAVSDEASIADAARLMRDYNIGSIPVCEGKHPIGIITDRDIVVRGISEATDAETNVSEIMSENLIYGSPDMDVHEAARIMAENQIRRLPVVENDRLVGMVSLGDIATHSEYMDEASEALTSISLPSRPQR